MAGRWGWEAEKGKVAGEWEAERGRAAGGREADLAPTSEEAN